MITLEEVRAFFHWLRGWASPFARWRCLFYFSPELAARW